MTEVAPLCFFLWSRNITLLLSLVGIQYLSEIIPKLNHGFVELNLSSVFAKKNISSLCSSFRKNGHFLVTLTRLDLSGNRFDSQTSASLAAFLASPNSIEELNLSGTLVAFDKIADAFSRGCSANLKRLLISDNKISNLEKLAQFLQLSRGLQVPLPFFFFFFFL